MLVVFILSNKAYQSISYARKNKKNETSCLKAHRGIAMVNKKGTELLVRNCCFKSIRG
jgi:hypothetical protein